MSSGSAPDTLSIADKLDAIRRALPPNPNRNGRLGHPSWEDFAALVDVTPARVHEWRRGEAFPDARNRARLAGLSDGAYSESDFTRDELEARRLDAVEALKEELEAKVDDLTVSVHALKTANQRLLKRVSTQDASVKLLRQQVDDLLARAPQGKPGRRLAGSES